MSKSLARIPVTMTPETKDVLHRLADLMDTSFARLAGSFLDDARPQLENLADALESFDRDPNVSLTAFHLALIEAQRHALQAQTDFLQEVGKPKPKP